MLNSDKDNLQKVNLLRFTRRLSELESHLRVYLPSREVVRHGIHLVGDIGNPVIRVHVAYVEEVEAVNAKPDVLENALAVTVLVVEKSVGHSYVNPSVCGGTEDVSLQFAVWSREWQAISVGQP